MGMYNTGKDLGQSKTRQNTNQGVKAKLKNKAKTTTPTTRPRQQPTQGHQNSTKGTNCCTGKGTKTTNPSKASSSSSFASGTSTAAPPNINTSLNNNSPAINNASTGNNTMQSGMKSTYTTGNPSLDETIKKVSKTTYTPFSSSHSYMTYGKNNIGQWASAANVLGTLGAKYNVPFSNVLQNVGSGPFTNSGLNSTFNSMMSIGAMGGNSLGGLAHANVATFQSALGNFHVNIFGSAGSVTKHTVNTSGWMSTTRSYTLSHQPGSPQTGKHGSTAGLTMSNYNVSHGFHSSTTHSSQQSMNWMAGVSANTNNANGLNYGIAIGHGQHFTSQGMQPNTMVAGAITYNWNKFNLGAAFMQGLRNAYNSVVNR